MDKVLSIVFLLTLSLACQENDLSRMDRCLRNSAKYENLLQDSLECLKAEMANASADSVKWDKARSLYEIYSHYQLDSCLRYSSRMTELAGEDSRRRVISLTALSRAYFSLGDNDLARTIYENIPEEGIESEKDCAELYYTVGSWIYKGTGEEEKREAAEKKILAMGDGFIETVKLKYERLCNEGHYEEAIRTVENFMDKELNYSEYARSNYFLAQIYHKTLNRDKEIHHLVLSACADVEAAVKNYNSLYELAMLLYSEGDLERAAAYMKKNLDDALFSSSSGRLLRSARSELLFSEALHKAQESRRRIITIAFILMIAVAIALIMMTLRLRRSALKLKEAHREVSELSSIKDGFLAQYMELSAGYIGEVDETKRRLRRALKKDGPEALAALLRTASYADSEYVNFYRNFDETFLSIYPDFVQKVNGLMQPGKEFEIEGKQLNAALRILALIRLGISGRTRIAKILNIGISTVYTYHSHFLRDALPDKTPFDQRVRGL